MKLSQRVIVIFDRTLDLFAALGAVLILAIMLTISVNIVFRYFLHLPMVGVGEISETMLLYITFLGTAWLLRREGHIAIDLVFIRLRPKTQARVNVMSSVIGAFISLALTWYGILASLSAWQRGVVTSTILEVPKGTILIIIPIGSLLLLFQFLRRAWLYCRGPALGGRKPTPG